MIHIRNFTFNLFEENTYVVWDETRECVIIDPGCQREGEMKELKDFISANSLKPKAILLTHAHLDHIFGTHSLCEAFGIRAWMDPRESMTIEASNAKIAGMGLKTPDKFDAEDVTDGMEIRFGASAAKALSTPGHTPGGLCWLFEADKALFTGDTLFRGCVGRTDLPGGDLDALQTSLRDSLMSLDGEIEIFPGHGPASDIAYERQTNPFIFEDEVPGLEEDGANES